MNKILLLAITLNAMIFSCSPNDAKETNVQYLLESKLAIDNAVAEFQNSGWSKVSRSKKGYITVITGSGDNAKTISGYETSAFFGAGDDSSAARSHALSRLLKQLDELGVSCIEGGATTYLDFFDGTTLAINPNSNRDDLIRMHHAQEIAHGWYYYINTDD